MPPPDLPETSSELAISAVNLPFLGSRRSPHATFQYLLQRVDNAGATFAIPSWVVRREHFRVGDLVELHLPFRTADGWHRQHAKVETTSWQEELGEQVCRVSFHDRDALHHPVYAAFEAGQITFRNEADELADLNALLLQLLRDCMLQKRGVGVYFKHLVPLFSRITLFPTEDYAALRGMVLDDVRKRIEANVTTLERWYDMALAGNLSAEAFTREVDLETLRVAVEGEIENELFEATFNSAAIRPYTHAIRLLEHKLYMNYNTLVLLYTRAV